MATEAELTARVRHIFSSAWDDKRKSYTVPSPDSLLLNSNYGTRLEGVVLYADLEESTTLVDNSIDWYAAEIYKAYLLCSAQIIKDNNGVVTAYDGDRVMGIFVGVAKEDNAVRAALKISGAIRYIINPSHAAQYNAAAYTVKHTIGIDKSEILAARVGVKNDNDIVWVGKAANHAAKLGAENFNAPIRISESVYSGLSLPSTHYLFQSMWTPAWSLTKNELIYISNWNCGTDYKF